MLDPSEKEEHFVLSVLWGVNAYIYIYTFGPCPMSCGCGFDVYYDLLDFLA